MAQPPSLRMRHLWPVRDQLEFETRERLRIASLSDSQMLRLLSEIFERGRRRKAAIEGVAISPIDIEQLTDDQVLALWGSRPGEQKFVLEALREAWSAYGSDKLLLRAARSIRAAGGSFSPSVSS